MQTISRSSWKKLGLKSNSNSYLRIKRIFFMMFGKEHAFFKKACSLFLSMVFLRALLLRCTISMNIAVRNTVYP
jgi:hypothetical protein